MNQDQLVIKGTILGLTYEQCVKDTSIFVSTASKLSFFINFFKAFIGCLVSDLPMSSLCR